MCELLLLGKRHIEVGARICHISIRELGMVHRFGGTHRQLQKNSHVFEGHQSYIVTSPSTVSKALIAEILRFEFPEMVDECLKQF